MEKYLIAFFAATTGVFIGNFLYYYIKYMSEKNDSNKTGL